MDDAPSLAPLIRRLRSSTGLTQEELAEKAGISVRTVSDIERGLRRSVYRDTAERLGVALEVEPTERATFVAIARGRTERIPTAGGSSSGSRFVVPPIPSPATRLIGREEEVGLVLSALGRSSIRLLTLTGAGGIGKSRIAIEASARAQGMFRDGVFFLPLASTDSAPGVMASLGRVLGMGVVEDPTVADIAGHLGTGEILIILDTFEHLLEAAPRVSELLSTCEGLRALVTSREALHVRGEHVIPVAPLEVRGSSAVDLETNPSTALFVERALSVKPDLDLAEQVAPVVVDICRRLSGLPLAIELAASRVQHLPLVALRDQLKSGLGLLNRGAADLPPRQRTMQDTIAWSYELLDPIERSLFRAVSVFVGGSTLDGADHVWRATTPNHDTLATMSALVDKSLVVAEANGPEPRYTMLDVIVEFAAEQRERHLESSALLNAHASFFLALAERAEADMGGSAQEGWYRRLVLEHDNLRSALRWASTQEDSELEVRLAGALWQFWRAEGHYAEGRAWIEQALATGPDASVDARAKAMWGASWLAFHQDDLRAVHRFSEQLTALAEEQDQSITRRNALTVRAMLHLAEGQFEAAVVPLRQSVDICDAVGARWLLATSKLNLALASMHTGRFKDASRLLEEASDLYLELGDERFAARTHVYRAHLSLLEGHRSDADESFRRGLRSFLVLEDHHGVAEALEGLAAVNAEGAAMEAAALLWGTAIRLREDSTSKRLPFERALIDRWVDEARASLGESRWDALLVEGGDVDVDQALARSTR
ncbi:MAG: helix-turn-helix domain-containing protein [Actinomycetota bacterium]|nr:helix-turn-helix domain-containing protein [Actinomycetota bacterium]